MLFDTWLRVQRPFRAGRAAGLWRGAGFPAQEVGLHQHLQLGIETATLCAGRAHQAHAGQHQQAAAPAFRPGAGVIQAYIHLNARTSAPFAAAPVTHLAQQGDAHPKPKLPGMLPGQGRPGGIAAGAYARQRKRPLGTGRESLHLQAEALAAEPFASAGDNLRQEKALSAMPWLGAWALAAGTGLLGQAVAAAGLAFALGAAGAFRRLHHFGQYLPAPFRTR